MRHVTWKRARGKMSLVTVPFEARYRENTRTGCDGRHMATSRLCKLDIPSKHERIRAVQSTNVPGRTSGSLKGQAFKALLTLFSEFLSLLQYSTV